MSKLELKTRKLLRRIFGGIGATAVAFIFQACYGGMFPEPPPPNGYDVKVTGTVKSKTTNLPVKGIKVKNSNSSNSRENGITDENGKFSFYIFGTGQTNFRLSFADIDGSENGCFADTIVVVDNLIRGDDIEVDVELSEIDCE